MVQDFRDFINRGNVVDLAVAVIIGAAFGRVTASLVDQVVMPPLGLLIGGVDFSELGFVLRDAHLYDTVSQAVAAGAPVVQLGAFLNTVINFVIIAVVVFLVVRAYNRALVRMRRAEVRTPPEPHEPAADVQLLTEIRDLLARRADDPSMSGR